MHFCEKMSSVNQAAIVCENGSSLEETLGWSYIEWHEQGLSTAGLASAQTQTVLVPMADKETQTSSPVILRMDSLGTDPKLSHPAMLVTPFFQFHRQAPARISTSPTLRRMRSTVRRPKTDLQDPSKAKSGQQELLACEPPFLGSLFSPAFRNRSPLAAPPRSPEQEHGQTDLSPDEVRNRSSRSNTLDNSEIRRREKYFSVAESVSGDLEQTNDSDQAKELSHKWLQERRRSSVVISLPGLDMSPGDLFVSNGAAGILSSSTNSDTKKSKWPFSRRGMQEKGKVGSVSDVMKHLLCMQVEDWRDIDLQRYKDSSLEGFLEFHGCKDRLEPGAEDCRRQEAVWELFTSECVYFLDQLMVLKQVFMMTLTYLQANDCLQDIDAWKLFANLNELCLVSFGFLTTFLRVIKLSWDIPVTGSPPELAKLLSKAFSESICHCQQKYCLNYSTATFYVDSLKQREDFRAYVKWCEGHPECRRLQLKDLQVAPLQRLTRYPLLLRNICKRSRGEEEQVAMEGVVQIVDRSIQDLEGKVKWLDNYQHVQQLKENLVWPQVWERNKRTFVPENLKHLVKTATRDHLLSQRCLLYEGKLSLAEHSKLREVHLFLFEEFLLVTKVKKSKKRPSTADTGPMRAALTQELHNGCSFTVLDQPISLDRLQLRSVDQLNALASGLHNSFVIIHQNRYQQCIGVFILQAGSEAIKKVWMSTIEGAVAALQRQDSQHARVRQSVLWPESSQI